MTDLVPVLPCDREAAASFSRSVGRLSTRDADNVLAGLWDETEDVQAFARHRLAALEEAAGWHDEQARLYRKWAAESNAPDDVLRKHAERARAHEGYATAIRSLSNTGEGVEASDAFARPTDPSDGEWSFWLNDAAGILGMNGSDMHADWVRKAADRLVPAASNKGWRDGE